MVVRATDIGPPKPISDSDFVEICSTFEVSLGGQAALRARLDRLVEKFASEVKNARHKPSPKRDAQDIKSALTDIQKARSKFRARGPAARIALNAMAPWVGPMVSARWLRHHFPADALVPKPKDPPGPRGDRRRWLGEQYDIEDLSLKERKGFVGDHPVETIGALLHDVEQGLNDALRSLRFFQKGGRKPLTFRLYFLANLACIWCELGNPVSGGPTSQFVAFCEAVSEAIHWPTEGVASAIPDAIKLWRNLSQKTA